MTRGQCCGYLQVPGSLRVATSFNVPDRGYCYGQRLSSARPSEMSPRIVDDTTTWREADERIQQEQRESSFSLSRLCTAVVLSVCLESGTTAVLQDAAARPAQLKGSPARLVDRAGFRSGRDAGKSSHLYKYRTHTSTRTGLVRVPYIVHVGRPLAESLMLC